MVSRDIDIIMSLDDSEPLAKFNALERRADDVAEKEVKLRREIKLTANKAASLAMATIGLLRNIFTIAGIQLDALQQAVLVSIQQVINTAVAWFTLQTAIAAGTFGAASVGMIAAAAALGVSIGTAAAIAVHGEQINTKMNAVLGALSNLESIAQTFASDI